VLIQAIRNGVGLLTWRSDAFAYAESYDEKAARYQGVRAGSSVLVTQDDSGILVRPDIAAKQLDNEVHKPAPGAPGASGDEATPGAKPTGTAEGGPVAKPVAVLRRFQGSVTVDASRVGRDAGKIAEEVISHLVGQMGAEVTVTLEIEARLPNGASDQLVRTVTENARVLKFSQHGFEKD
jgi:hypothetical protein